MNLKFDFEFVETKFLSVWGRAPCKFYGCQAWGHLLQGTAAGGSTTFSINALGRAMLKNKTWIEMPPSIDGRVCSMCRKTRDQLNIVTFQKYAWPVAATGQFYGLLSRAQQWIGQFYCFPTWSHTPAQMLPKGPNFAQESAVQFHQAPPPYGGIPFEQHFSSPGASLRTPTKKNWAQFGFLIITT